MSDNICNRDCSDEELADSASSKTSSSSSLAPSLRGVTLAPSLPGKVRHKTLAKKPQKAPLMPLIGGGVAGRSIGTDTRFRSLGSMSEPDVSRLKANTDANVTPSKNVNAANAKNAGTKSVSVWMTERLRNDVEANFPRVHRGSLVAIAYNRHHLKMYSEPMLRPGSAAGEMSRNWTAHVSEDVYSDIKALASHLCWPVAAVIKKLLQFELEDS